MLAPFLLVGVILLVNWITIDRSPRPWLDEALFADPGFNLAQGHGFTSGWWPGQPRGEVFAGNAPMYSLVVAGWSTVFGPSVSSLRLLNAFLLGLAAWLLIVGLRRRDLLTDWRSELLLIFLLYGGYAMTFVYRSARYDVLGILLCAALFAVIMLPRREFSWLLVIGIAALLPATGLQLLPFVAAVCIMRLLFDPDLKRGFTDGALIATGMALGGAIFVGLLAHLGVADRLFASLAAFSDRSSDVLGHAAAVWQAVRTDPSSVMLFGLLALAALIPATRRAMGPGATRALILFGLLLPAIMAIAGRFPIYYGWMRFIPLVIILVVVVDRLHVLSSRRAVLALCAASLIIGFGLPGRFFLSVKHWSANDPAPLKAAVQSWVEPGDVVYSTPLAYFAVRSVTPEVYGPSYFWWSPKWQYDADINVLVVTPAEALQVLERLGGEWRIIERYIPRSIMARNDDGIGQAYHVLVGYRRVASNYSGPQPTEVDDRRDEARLTSIQLEYMP